MAGSGHVRHVRKEKQRAEVVQLYDHALPDLHRLLARKLGNAEEAREVAQDTFEKLLRQAEREDIRDVRRLAFTVANRLALDVLRRRRVKVRYLHQQGLASDEAATGDDPEWVSMGREQLLAVQRALTALPEKTRHVFLLHRFESYTYIEIARQLGLSQKSIEYHMNRALTAVTAAVDQRP